MTAEDQIYKCSVCGNTVKVITAGDGELVCCSKPMELKTLAHEEDETAFLGDEDLAKINGEELSNIYADSEDQEFDEEEDETE